MEGASMAVDKVDAVEADGDDGRQLSERTSSICIDEEELDPILEQTNKWSLSERLVLGTTSVYQKNICFKVPLMMAHHLINYTIGVAPGDTGSECAATGPITYSAFQ